MIVKVCPSNIYHFNYETYLESTNIDFVDTDNSAGDHYLIVTEIGDRKSVLYLDDNDFDAGDGIDFYHEGFDITTTGTIEFLVYTVAAHSADLTITLYDGATRLIKIVYDENEFDFDYDNGGGLTEIYNGGTTGWYIVRIDIDIAAGVNGQFDCYIKDSSYTTLGSVTGIEFENNATTVDKIRFDTLTVNGSGYYALDLIGITAEGGYVAGGIQYAEVDVSAYLENTRIHDGIIPYKKIFTFDCHHNYEDYFNEGDYIDVWDVNGVLSFRGYIKTKSRDNAGIYKLTCYGMANEVFERTYDKSFSSDKTSEKLQDIIDNCLKSCYRDTSITITTTDYSYEYDRACIYMFNLARYMERQVVYIEPDGKVVTRDYDDLLKQSEYYMGTYNFRDEADGTSGTDIDFIDNVAAGSAVVVEALLDGHRKVIKYTATGDYAYNQHYFSSAQDDKSIEFWARLEQVNLRCMLYFYDADLDNILMIAFHEGGNIQYYDGGFIDTGFTYIADTWYHFKIEFDCAADWHLWIDGVSIDAGGGYTFHGAPTAMDGLNMRIKTAAVIYIDGWGESWDTNYNVGDNLLAGWYLYDNNQNALLIDIPGLKDSIPGYYFGNTGITSVSVRYKDNTTVIRPATPTETFKKKRLKEFRDPKIQASTEANQLGDNLYDIFSADTIFLGMNVKGKGWLQPGKVIAIINTNQIAITTENFLILKVVYDPKNDVQINMILSNNIITPNEFKSDLDTSSQQVHTATLQSFENQAAIPTSKKRTVPLDIVNHNATEGSGFFLLDAADEYVGTTFWADIDIVDTDQDILFTWIIQPDAAGILDIKKYQFAIKTDGSEATSWNIEDGTADNKNLGQSRTYQWIYTFAAADIDGDDSLHALMYSNDVIDFRVYGVFVTYYLK